jgi:hypothetical protein
MGFSRKLFNSRSSVVHAGRGATAHENAAGCHPRMGHECTNNARHSWIRAIFVDGRSAFSGQDKGEFAGIERKQVYD